jgi:hypothetical protein
MGAECLSSCWQGGELAVDPDAVSANSPFTWYSVVRSAYLSNPTPSQRKWSASDAAL